MTEPFKTVVAIDGPAGSGKSTVAAKLAKRLGFVHLNSGQLFRALAQAAHRHGVPLEGEDALADLASRIQFRFELAPSDGSTRLAIDGVDAGEDLRSAAAGEAASRVAVHAKVREVFVELQRKTAVQQPLVVEGRDAGTIVFPDARFKFFLNASPEVRAARRFKELGQTSTQGPTLAQVAEELRQRDYRDSTRKVAPQVQAEDATLIDTSELNADEVVELLYKIINRSLNQHVGS